MSSIVQVEQAAYRYPQNGHGLAPTTLAVRPGESVLVTGPSGCGKSTLARCLTGLIPHLYRGRLSGEVWLDGLRTIDTPLWRLPERAGLVFQNPATQMLALLAALIVVTKIALRLPLQLPGHSGIFWMAIVMVAAGVVPKRGAVSPVGVTSGVIAAFLEMGDFGALNTFLSYTMVGVGTDLALLLLRDPENLVVATIAGVLGHLGKFLVKWGLGALTGAPVGFIAFGLLRAVLGYIVFGALGGLLGGLTLAALRQAGFFSYTAEKR